MKLFLFDYVEQVSERYHPEGGLVIIANSADDAKAMIAADEYIKPTETEWAEAKVFEMAGDYEPKVFVFPDAGCC